MPTAVISPSPGRLRGGEGCSAKVQVLPWLEAGAGEQLGAEQDGSRAGREGDRAPGQWHGVEQDPAAPGREQP